MSISMVSTGVPATTYAAAPTYAAPAMTYAAPGDLSYLWQLLTCRMLLRNLAVGHPGGPVPGARPGSGPGPGIEIQFCFSSDK